MRQRKSKMRNFLLKVCFDIVSYALTHLLFRRTFSNHQFWNKKGLPLFSGSNKNLQNWTY